MLVKFFDFDIFRTVITKYILQEGDGTRVKLHWVDTWIGKNVRVVNDIFFVVHEKDAVASIINYLIAIFEHKEEMMLSPGKIKSISSRTIKEIEECAKIATRSKS